MSLPRELRDKIYEAYHPLIARKPTPDGFIDFHLRVKVGSTMSQKPLAMIDTEDGSLDKSSLALMNACKQIREEMRSILRKPRYVIDLTDFRLYWRGEPLLNRFLMYDLRGILEPSCLRIVFLTDFEWYTRRFWRRRFGIWEEEEIVETMIEGFGSDMKREWGLKQLQCLEVAVKGSLDPWLREVIQEKSKAIPCRIALVDVFEIGEAMSDL